MELFLSIVLGLLAGALLATIVAHAKSRNKADELTAVRQELDAARQDAARLSAQMESLKVQFDNERQMILQSHQKEIESMRQQAVEKQQLIETNHSHIVESLKEAARKEVEALTYSFAIEIGRAHNSSHL